jgi:hypothetical protein
LRIAERGQPFRPAAAYLRERQPAREGGCQDHGKKTMSH